MNVDSHRRRMRCTVPVVLLIIGGCGGATDRSSPSGASSTARPSLTTSSPSPLRPTEPPKATPTTASPRPRSSEPPPPTSVPKTTPSTAGAPVIVVDPGHSVTVHEIDPATGMDGSDYENEPEMRDVFAVATIVRKKLVADGYRVIMTKPSLDASVSLVRRAQIANNAHAALAISIHDQAGANGGIGFEQGNNTVYFQSVGNFRESTSGKRIYFTNAAVAKVSQRYGRIFQRQRAAAQGVNVNLLGDTGYDLGSRGLPAGNIWIVQLLAQVPWIYNEAGGNSAGQVGLSAADQRRYAAGLIAAVRACVPVKS